MPLRKARTILDDAEWALVDALDRVSLKPSGVIAEADLVEDAAAHSSFDAERLAAAAASLRTKRLLVAVGEGEVQVGHRAQRLLGGARVAGKGGLSASRPGR